MKPKLYENIKARRTELHMTQTELAHKVGYADKSMVAKVEKGQIDISRSKISEFAKALDINPADLIGADDLPEDGMPVYIDEELDRILRVLKSDTSITFANMELDKASKELIADSLTTTMRVLRALNNYEKV